MEVLFWIALVIVVAFGIYKLVTRDNDSGGSGGGGRGGNDRQNRH